MKTIHPDWSLVLSLGGATKVAERLGWSAAGGVQRVQNWKYRGIPAIVRLEHPRLFRKPAAVAQLAQQPAARDAFLKPEDDNPIDNTSK